MIIATGFGGGGEYDRSHMKVIMVNELTGPRWRALSL